MKYIIKIKLFIISQQTFVGLEDVFKTSGDNKSKCVSSKSIFHKSISDNSKANPKCIN